MLGLQARERGAEGRQNFAEQLGDGDGELVGLERGALQVAAALVAALRCPRSIKISRIAWPRR